MLCLRDFLKKTKMATGIVTKARVFRPLLNRTFPIVSSTSWASVKKHNFSHVAAPSPIYELRIYRIIPKDFKTTLDLFEKYIPLRMKHSKLFGYWTAEIGDAIQQVMHIWEYDSLSHRRQVRLNLLSDKEWQNDFMVHFTATAQIMTNSLIVPVPGTVVNADFPKDPNAVYSLQSVPASTPFPSSEDPGELLVGRWLNVLGSTNTELRLRRYADIDSLFAGAWKTALDKTDGSCMLLNPTKFSPIQ